MTSLILFRSRRGISLICPHPQLWMSFVCPLGVRVACLLCVCTHVCVWVCVPTTSIVSSKQSWQTNLIWPGKGRPHSNCLSLTLCTHPLPHLRRSCRPHFLEHHCYLLIWTLNPSLSSFTRLHSPHLSHQSIYFSRFCYRVRRPGTHASSYRVSIFDSRRRRRSFHLTCPVITGDRHCTGCHNRPEQAGGFKRPIRLTDGLHQLIDPPQWHTVTMAIIQTLREAEGTGVKGRRTIFLPFAGQRQGRNGKRRRALKDMRRRLWSAFTKHQLLFSIPLNNLNLE